MNAAISRKHPRVHEKKRIENNYDEENTINLSAMTALGILIVIFVKGILLGYIVRNSMD